MKQILTAIGLVCALAHATLAAAAQEKTSVDLSRYAGSSTNLTAVATAVSMVEPCDGEIMYGERVVESYRVVELAISCSGDANGGGVILRFDMLDGGGLRPASFGVAQ